MWLEFNVWELRWLRAKYAIYDLKKIAMLKTMRSLLHPNLLNWIIESSTFMSTLFSLSFTAKLTVHISNKWSSYDVCTCSPWGLTVNKTKPPGRVLQEKLGGVCGPIAKTLTLFMTKNLQYSLPYLRPDPYIKTLFQTCVMISSLVQTPVQTNVKLPSP